MTADASGPPGAGAPAGSAFKRAVGAAGVYTLSSVLSRAGAIVLIPLYTRRLSLADYGDYALAQTVMQILPSVLSLGLVSAVARFFFEGRDVATAQARTAAVARAQILLSVAFAALLQAGVLLARPGGTTGLFGRWELSCMVWASAGGAIAAIPSAYLRVRQRPIATSLFQLGQFLCFTGAGILLVSVLGRGLRGSIEAAALAYVVNGLAAVVFVLRALKGPLRRDVLREALRFSLPFVPHYVASQSQLIADRWTMKGAGLAEALGGYSLASQLATPTSMLVGAWNDAVGPSFGEAYRTGGLPALAARYWSWVRTFLVVAGGGSLLTVAGLPVVGLLVGDAFRHALWITPWLLCSIIIETLYYPSFDVLFFANRSGVIPFITALSTFLSVALNILLVPRYGVVGAIAARLCSMSVRSAVIFVAARRSLRGANAAAGAGNQ